MGEYGNLVPFLEDGRSANLRLDVEECRAALWRHRGNISLAADELRVSSLRLREFVNASPALLKTQTEARERIVDRAEEVVREALEDPENAGRRDTMARFVLNSNLAERRGFSAKTVKVNVSTPGPVIIGWAGDPGFDDVANDEMVIEHGTGEALD